jgi:hypothetical protein
MHKQARLYAGLAIVVLAASFAGTASANSITASPAGAITATSLGRLSFAGRGGIEISINCRVTLRGTLNSIIFNGTGGRLGSITEGRADECNTGTITLLVEPRNPWPILLDGSMNLSFNPKQLPVTLTNVQIQISGILGQTCLYTGSVPMLLEAEGPREAAVTRLVTIRANSERIVRNSGLCPERGELSGTFSLTTQTLRL